MDFTHLESLLSTLETRLDKIKALTDYILLNSSSSENQVGTALFKVFNNAPIDRKLAVFYTISQILLISSQKREVAFFKVFGSKIRSLLQTLSLEVKDIRVMRDICRTLDKWQSEEMFAGSFMQKLKAAVKDFYIKVRQQDNAEDKSIGFRKYKKTFLMEIYDLRNSRTSYEVYQNYCQYAQIEQKLTNLNLQFNKIDFDRSENSELNKRRCEQLLKIYKDQQEKLQNCLVKIHNSFHKMRESALEELNNLKKESGVVAETNKNP